MFILLAFINAKFLYNLDRTFSTGDDKVLDVSIDMSNDDYQKVLESVQVSKEDHYAKTVNNVKIKVNVTISDNRYKYVYNLKKKFKQIYKIYDYYFFFHHISYLLIFFFF